MLIERILANISQLTAIDFALLATPNWKRKLNATTSEENKQILFNESSFLSVFIKDLNELFEQIGLTGDPYKTNIALKEKLPQFNSEDLLHLITNVDYLLNFFDSQFNEIIANEISLLSALSRVLRGQYCDYTGNSTAFDKIAIDCENKVSAIKQQYPAFARLDAVKNKIEKLDKEIEICSVPNDIFIEIAEFDEKEIPQDVLLSADEKNNWIDLSDDEATLMLATPAEIKQALISFEDNDPFKPILEKMLFDQLLANLRAERKEIEIALQDPIREIDALRANQAIEADSLRDATEIEFLKNQNELKDIIEKEMEAIKLLKEINKKCLEIKQIIEVFIQEQFQKRNLPQQSHQALYNLGSQLYAEEIDSENTGSCQKTLKQYYAICELEKITVLPKLSNTHQTANSAENNVKEKLNQFNIQLKTFQPILLEKSEPVIVKAIKKLFAVVKEMFSSHKKRISLYEDTMEKTSKIHSTLFNKYNSLQCRRHSYESAHQVDQQLMNNRRYSC